MHEHRRAGHRAFLGGRGREVWCPGPRADQAPKNSQDALAWAGPVRDDPRQRRRRAAAPSVEAGRLCGGAAGHEKIRFVTVLFATRLSSASFLSPPPPFLMHCRDPAPVDRKVL